MKSIQYSQCFLPSSRSLAVITLSVAAMLASQGAFAQGLFSASVELAGNMGESNVTLAQNSDSNGNPVTASITQSFSGLDSSNNPQTMTFSGLTTSSAQYGQLHVYTTGSLTNSYYNANNPDYAGPSGNVANANGSPDSLASLGFAVFADSLQFGGVSVTNYQAQYIFHLSGTNTGAGALEDLAVTWDNDASEYQDFFNSAPGYTATDWATNMVTVNNSNQFINVQFSDQVVFNTYQMTDGTSASGTADFSDTLSLAGVELFDMNGNELGGWTMSSASGTGYHKIETAPEPGTLPCLLGLSGTALFAQWRRRKKMAR